MEDAYVLDLADLLAAHAAGRQSVSVRQPSFPWLTGGRQEVAFKLHFGEAEGVVELTYAADANGQEGYTTHAIALEALRPNYGGLRWWFRCGVTGRRASKLYLFQGETKFCHRAGIQPKPIYLCQRVKGVNKVCRRLHALRQTIPGQGSILEPLKRPRGMHFKTYAKLLQRDAAIWNSTDNRLLALLRLVGY